MPMRQRPISKRLARFLGSFGTRLCPIEQCPKYIYVLWRDRRSPNSPIVTKAFTWREWRQGATARMGNHDYMSRAMRDLANKTGM